jgi:hypothetical protein
MIDASEILKELEDTDPILLGALGTAFLPCARVVQRENVGPATFAFLYQALRSHNRPIAEIHEFQISVRDATELLRACSSESSRA